MALAMLMESLHVEEEPFLKIQTVPWLQTHTLTGELWQSLCPAEMTSSGPRSSQVDIFLSSPVMTDVACINGLPPSDKAEPTPTPLMGSLQWRQKKVFSSGWHESQRVGYAYSVGAEG